MYNYLGKRTVSAFISFFLFTAFLFFSFSLLIPYDFVDTLSLSLRGTAAREALRVELGLNLPIWQQYLHWLGELARGNFGRQFALSGRGAPVTDLLPHALITTLYVFVTGAFLAFALGYWLGKITVWRSPRWLNGTVTISSIAFYTAFPPWLAFLTGYLLIARFSLLPPRAAQRSLNRKLWFDAPISPTTLMMYLLLSLLLFLVLVFLVNWALRRSGRRKLPAWGSAILLLLGLLIFWRSSSYWPYVLDLTQAAAVPFIAFVLLAFGDTLLLTQTSMRNVQHEPYVQTARAKGLSDSTIRNKHVARNALLPVLSRFVISLPWLLTAVVIIEYSTSWPGIGSLLFDSIYNQNTFVYMDILVIVALVSLVARLALDVAYAYLDPRIRFGQPAKVKRAA